VFPAFFSVFDWSRKRQKARDEETPKPVVLAFRPKERYNYLLSGKTIAGESRRFEAANHTL